MDELAKRGMPAKCVHVQKPKSFELAKHRGLT